MARLNGREIPFDLTKPETLRTAFSETRPDGIGIVLQLTHEEVATAPIANGDSLAQRLCTVLVAAIGALCIPLTMAVNYDDKTRTFSTSQREGYHGLRL